MFYAPERTSVRRDGSLWTVSTIPSRWGIETIAFEEGGRDRSFYVAGETHEEAVAIFAAATTLPAETHEWITASD